MSAARSSRRARLALVLAAASWGLGTVVSKRAVDEINPIALLPTQLGASLLALVVLARWRRWPVAWRTTPRVLGRLGVLNPGVAYALSLAGLTQISASLSVLLWATEPVLIVVLAALVLHERVGWAFVALSVLAAAGMTLVIYEPGTTGSAPGVALTLAGVACCAVYSVVSRRRLGAVDSTVSVVVSQQAHALVLALVLAAVLVLAGHDALPARVSLVAWASAVASGVMYYGAAYVFYLAALRQMPATSAAASFYLIPVFGVGGGVLLLREALTPAQVLGASAVLVAVFVILAGLRPFRASRAAVA